MTLRSTFPMVLPARLGRGLTTSVARLSTADEQARLEATEAMTLHRFKRDADGCIRVFEIQNAFCAVCSECGAHSAPMESDVAEHAKTMGFCI